MDQLILEVQTYAAACGLLPTTVVQRAIGASGVTWRKWTEQGASCSLTTADRLRAWMRENPPAADKDPVAPTEDAA
jgi:hypothetical protein